MFFYFHDIWIGRFYLFPTGYFAGKTARQEGRSAWTVFWVILVGLVMAAAGAYLLYKYRIRVSLVTFSQFSDAITFLFYSILILYSIMAFNEIHQFLISWDLLLETVVREHDIWHLLCWCFCSLIWILRSEPSWHSICPWTANQRL